MSPIRDIAKGERFGMRVVLGDAATRSGRVHKRCRCDCGEVASVEARALLHGRSQGCRKCMAKARSRR